MKATVEVDKCGILLEPTQTNISLEGSEEAVRDYENDDDVVNNDSVTAIKNSINILCTKKG